MTREMLDLRQLDQLAVEYLPDHPDSLLRLLDENRARLWRNGWHREAHDVALSAISVAQVAENSLERLRLARWLARHFPDSDSFLLLGESLCAADRRDAGRAAWKRAAKLAKREGSLENRQTAERHLALHESAVNAMVSFGVRVAELAGRGGTAALPELLRRHRSALRNSGARDAEQILRVCVLMCERANDVSRAAQLASRLVVAAPSAQNVCLLASIELRRGRRLRALRLACRCQILARKEGSLTHLRSAMLIREQAEKARSESM